MLVKKVRAFVLSSQTDISEDYARATCFTGSCPAEESNYRNRINSDALLWTVSYFLFSRMACS